MLVAYENATFIRLRIAVKLLNILQIQNTHISFYVQYSLVLQFIVRFPQLGASWEDLN